MFQDISALLVAKYKKDPKFIDKLIEKHPHRFDLAMEELYNELMKLNKTYNGFIPGVGYFQEGVSPITGDQIDSNFRLTATEFGSEEAGSNYDRKIKYNYRAGSFLYRGAKVEGITPTVSLAVSMYRERTMFTAPNNILLSARKNWTQEQLRTQYLENIEIYNDMYFNPDLVYETTDIHQIGDSPEYLKSRVISTSIGIGTPESYAIGGFLMTFREPYKGKVSIGDLAERSRGKFHRVYDREAESDLLDIEPDAFQDNMFVTNEFEGKNLLIHVVRDNNKPSEVFVVTKVDVDDRFPIENSNIITPDNQEIRILEKRSIATGEVIPK
jgi:hypothetical protein